MGDKQMLAIAVRDRGADVVIAVSGEIDFATTPELLAVAEPLAAAGRTLLLDLDEVPFCDSSGLSALVRLHKKCLDAGGGALRLARLRPQVEATITVTMLHRMLEISAEVPPSSGGEVTAPAASGGQAQIGATRRPDAAPRVGGSGEQAEVPAGPGGGDRS